MHSPRDATCGAQVLGQALVSKHLQEPENLVVLAQTEPKMV